MAPAGTLRRVCCAVVPISDNAGRSVEDLILHGPPHIEHREQTPHSTGVMVSSSAEREAS